MYTSNLFSVNNDMVDWLKFYTISNLRVSLIEFHKRVIFFFVSEKQRNEILAETISCDLGGTVHAQLKEMTLGVRVRVIPNAIHHKYIPPPHHHHHFTLFMYFSQQYITCHTVYCSFISCRSSRWGRTPDLINQALAES